MKRLVAFVSMLVIAAAPAFAAGVKPQTVIIPQTMQVGSTQLAAGTYKLEYTGTGASVQVTLTQGKKTVLTFAATAIDKKTVNPGVDIINNGPVTSLESINLSKVTLQVTDAPHVGQ
jgi:YD repeat-containing protein